MDKIKARWFSSLNWGDALNPVLIKYISGADVQNLNDSQEKPRHDEDVFIVIGSILSWYGGNNLVVWGPGFMGSHERMCVKPKRIHAVRGPLTRQVLLQQGLRCPKVYGDPALLLPRFIKRDRKTTYPLGVIPAGVDSDSPLVGQFRGRDDILMIDIRSGVEKVVDDIMKCERIASSALHGIIAADAYGIPSTWLKFTENTKPFKYLDYFESVGRRDREPLVVTEAFDIDRVYDAFYEYEIDIDLDKLLSDCPFSQWGTKSSNNWMLNRLFRRV